MVKRNIYDMDRNEYDSGVFGLGEQTRNLLYVTSAPK